MALNRYLYPQKGTNIVQQVTLRTRVNVAGTSGTVGTIVAGFGMTVAHAGSGVYNVTLDNASSVSSVVCARAGYVSAYAAASHIQFHVTAVSTTGCTLQAYQSGSGGPGVPQVDGTLWVELVCSLSSVPA